MLELTDDQKLQILLVGAPILSMIGTWMSLRTYGRLKHKSEQKARQRQEVSEGGHGEGGHD